MVVIDYPYQQQCAHGTTYSTTTEAYVSPTTATTTTCTCSSCRQSYITYTRTYNDDVDVEEPIQIIKHNWPRLNLKIKPTVKILDNKPLVIHRRTLFSKSGWLLSKGKLRRRGY